MRILYHHRTKSRDGQYVHISELQAAFRRGGHELHEVAPGAGDGGRMGGESRGLSLLSKLVPAGLHEVMEWGYNLVSLNALSRGTRAFTPQWIYERYALGNVAGILAARRFRIPLLLEVNAPLAAERERFGGLTFPGTARRLEAFIFKGADRVLAVTEVLRAMIIEAGAHPDRVVVIPNGIDPERFHDRTPTEKAKRALGLEGRTVLGFTGFCRDWHGLDRILRLMAEGRDDLDDTHFLIVGDGPACPGLVDLAGELGLGDRITVTGVVQRDELVPLIAAFDLALQPDVTAYASPLKLFEYMALGKAIVAPDRANIREIVRDGESALLFPPGDSDALAAALRRALGDPALRERIGNAARDLVRDTPYTWDHNAARIEAIARSLCR